MQECISSVTKRSYGWLLNWDAIIYVAVGKKVVYGHCSWMFFSNASLLVMEVSFNNKTALNHCVIIRTKRGIYYPSLDPGNLTVLPSFGSDQVSKTLFSLALIVVPGDACEILIPSWRSDVIIFQKFLPSSKFHSESKWDKIYHGIDDWSFQAKVKERFDELWFLTGW